MESKTAAPANSLPAAAAPRMGLTTKVAAKYGVEAGKLLSTLRQTAFRQSERDATNEEMMALLVVADQYGLNPFTRELFAFFDKHKGIVPVVSVDGWSRIINERDELDGIEFEFADDDKGKVVSCTCIIRRKDRGHPIKITEYLSECHRDTGPWKSHPRRMLRHKALIQCSRVAFGFSGIFDEDEAQRVIEAGEGSPILPDAGDPVAREGVLEEATRTSTLAADLSKQAKGATDAEVIDSDGVVTVTIKGCEELIGSAKDQPGLDKAREAIMSLPSGPERVALLVKWNARSQQITGDIQPVPKKEPTPAPQPEATASPAAPSPAKPPAAEAGAKKEKEPVAEKKAEAAAVTKPAATPAVDVAGTDAICEQVVAELTAAKNVDELDVIADRENSRVWNKKQRGVIYKAYMEMRAKLGA